MKCTIIVTCVISAMVFVAPQQIIDQLKEGFCKLQCVSEVNSPNLIKTDCECNHSIIPHLDLLNMTKYGTSELKLKCKAEDMFLVEWSPDFNPFNKTDYTAYFLHVKSFKEIITDVVFQHYYIIENLTPNTSYSITLWGIDDKHNVFVSRPLIVTTNEINKIPLPVSNITIDLNLNLMTYEANVKWTPASDLSCYYEIVLHCAQTSNANDVLPAPQIYEIYPSAELFSSHITDLRFNYTYVINIRSIGPKVESESTKYSIQIPTCIESYKNLTICEPEQPQNLTIIEFPSSGAADNDSNVYDIRINWTRPSLIPDHYIAKLNIFDINRNVKDTPHLTIPGEAHCATFEKIRLSSYYQVHLQAISAGGRSIVAVKNQLYMPPTRISSTPEEKTNSLKYLSIIVGILGVALCFGLVAISIRQKRFNRINSKLKHKNFNNINMKQFQCTTDNQVVKENDEWEISIDSLSFKTILGEGAFGIVWHALYDQTPVACKTLKENSTADEIRQLLQEIEIMKYVGSHPNIVSMIGCITENVTNGPILIVEYCSKGDLLTYLRTIYNHFPDQLTTFKEDTIQGGSNYVTNKLYEYDVNQSETNLCLSYIDVLSLGRQIAQGMEYLSNQKILHRDLAARNILMCNDKRVKVCDFGLSRDVYVNRIYCKTTSGKLPLRWMALESLTHQIYTSQSDVWSFGILLWEIVTFGAIPYPGVQNEELLSILKEGERMTKPQFCSDDIYSIMENCWKESPTDRPTFSSLKEAFEELLINETDYLELSIS